MTIQDPIGKKFGRLTMQHRIGVWKGHIHYMCVCDCGNAHQVTRNNLLKGMSSQCSVCSNKQRSTSQIVFDCNAHRGAYNSYRSILLRTTEHLRYMDVPVCDRWKDQTTGFLNFLEDMGDRPEGCTIDRINNELGYSKENCRWATASVQNHNKGKRIDSKGPTKGVVLGDNGKIVTFLAQIQKDGIRYSKTFGTMEDAATYYDNLSEVLYGDRPNGTEKRLDLYSAQQMGGYTQPKNRPSYRLRIPDLMGNRKTVGYFKTKELADEALELCIELALDFRLPTK